jgi:DNA-binding NarL/FixJ family response regulator
VSRVLLVEPEGAVRELVTDLLRSEGHDVVAAAGPRDGLEALAAAEPDLVVCADDLLDSVRARAPEVPVVLVTDASVGPENVTPLPRPFTASQLVEAVRGALGAVRIRVIVVEDHPAVRASLVAYFDAQDDMEVVGEAENGWEAYKLAREAAPDFVLMDIRMPVMDGIEGTRMIKGRRPETRVVLLSAYEQDELIEAGLAAGAEGFLLKGASGRELVAAVREGAGWAA